MTNREIKAALGMRDGASGRQVENAAIRAWCVGGEDILDALRLLHRSCIRSRERGLTRQAELSQKAIELLSEIRENMLAWVRAQPAENMHRR